jgi:hypothetical protein
MKYQWIVNMLLLSYSNCCGSSKIDEAFMILLEDIFGVMAVASYKNRYPSHWVDIIDEFELRKMECAPLPNAAAAAITPRHVSPPPPINMNKMNDNNNGSINGVPSSSPVIHSSMSLPSLSHIVTPSVATAAVPLPNYSIRLPRSFDIHIRQTTGKSCKKLVAR